MIIKKLVEKILLLYKISLKNFADAPNYFYDLRYENTDIKIIMEFADYPSDISPNRQLYRIVIFFKNSEKIMNIFFHDIDGPYNYEILDIRLISVYEEYPEYGDIMKDSVISNGIVIYGNNIKRFSILKKLSKKRNMITLLKNIDLYLGEVIMNSI